MKLEHNISRIQYLLELYQLSVDNFLQVISDKLRNPLTRDDIFSNEIQLNHLKRIDKVFNKGIHFYLDPSPVKASKDASIFFRKQQFNSELNLASKKVINKFEELKISLSAISKLSDLDFPRTIPVYSINDNPREIADEIRNIIYPRFSTKLRGFLQSLIHRFAEQNILVFEFVETYNQKEKANLDGFFLQPNVIVLKRQQNSFRREIFTLAHELGHYLLNEEEVDTLTYQSISNRNLSKIERWCNDFAYYYLAGNHYSTLIDNLDTAKPSNDYHHSLIQTISSNTHLSRIALFTRLLFQNKISYPAYRLVQRGFEEEFRKNEEEKQRIKEIEKQQGIKREGRTPQPIKSPLLVSTIQTAFYEGVLNEYEVCKTLNIKPEKLNKYIQ